MGFMNSLLDVIKRERPDHLAVCFDRGGSVDRVEMFAEPIKQTVTKLQRPLK